MLGYDHLFVTLLWALPLEWQKDPLGFPAKEIVSECTLCESTSLFSLSILSLTSCWYLVVQFLPSLFWLFKDNVNFILQFLCHSSISIYLFFQLTLSFRLIFFLQSLFVSLSLCVCEFVVILPFPSESVICVIFFQEHALLCPNGK